MPSSLTTVMLQRKDAGNTGITFITGSNEAVFVSYRSLYERALSCLGFLQQKGMQPGDELVLSVADNETFLVMFWAALLGGIIPVPLAVAHHTENTRKLCQIWRILSNPFLLACPQALAGFRKSLGNPETAIEEILYASRIATTTDIAADHPNGKLHFSEPDHIAFVQFSSGSTGHPKGVTLTHRNLLTNIMAIIAGAGMTTADSTMSWMPLTHDMGMIGFHLTPLVRNIPQYIMPPELFVRNPFCWLQSLANYKATLTSSPNFGYRHLLNHVNADKLAQVDLSAVRLIFNGAEPISMELCRTFLTALAPSGLSSNGMFTVYGLAEATLAVTFPALGSPLSGIRISRHFLGIGQHIQVDGTAGDVEYANLGKPVSNCRIRITTENGATLEEGVVGYVHISGANVTAAYYNNPTATDEIIRDGWLNTKDLGFMLNGHLYITGRAKDIIFAGGLNFYAHDIERIAEELEETEAGKVAASAVPDPITETDALAIFVQYRKSVADFYSLSQSLKTLIAARLGIQPKYIVPVKSIPKTTSGKLKRFQLAAYFREGTYNDVLEELDKLHDEKMEAQHHAPLTTMVDFSAAAIRQWLIQYLSNRLQIAPGKIDTGSSFTDLGLTSIMAVELADNLGNLLHRKIDVTITWNFANIDALALYLSEEEQDTAVADEQLATPELDLLSEDALAAMLMNEIKR